MALMLAACGTKKEALPLQTSGNLAKDSVEAQKSKAKVTKEATTVGGAKKPYFAKVQILTEVRTQGECDPGLRKIEEVTEAFVGGVTQDGKMDATEIRQIDSLFNVQLRSIGFDQSNYQFSLVNSQSKSNIPYNLSISPRPNNNVQFKFLNEVVQISLESTPIYTFSATEKRGSCEIQHNVNIFAENAGRFERN